MNNEMASQDLEKEKQALVHQLELSEKRIAELMLANEELRAQNEEKEKRAAHLHTVLDRIDDGFFAIDTNSFVTYWNRKAETLLNTKMTDMMGKNLHEMFADSRSPIFYENYQKATREKSTITFEGFSNRTGKWFGVSAFGTDDGLSVYFKDITEKKQYELNLTKAIIKTQEDERYEIGGELHENVCQILVGSLLSLGMLKDALPPSRIEMFDKCREYISLSLAEIRNLSHRLAPAFFNEETLEEAFGRLIDMCNVEKKLAVSLQFDEQVNSDLVSREIQLNLYRILQEQLKNILKYANASVIEVQVLIEGNKLRMLVADNGVGFNVDSIKTGIGFANMKRRAELFSGKFDIISSPGKGCAVSMEIPLKL